MCRQPCKKWQHFKEIWHFRAISNFTDLLLLQVLFHPHWRWWEIDFTRCRTWGKSKAGLFKSGRGAGGEKALECSKYIWFLSVWSWWLPDYIILPDLEIWDEIMTFTLFYQHGYYGKPGDRQLFLESWRCHDRNIISCSLQLAHTYFIYLMAASGQTDISGFWSIVIYFHQRQ